MYTQYLEELSLGKKPVEIGGLHMKHQSLKEKVYDYISHQIQTGGLTPDQRITEQEVCSQLGVSRTPAREALLQLAADGLLAQTPRKGFVVKRFDKSEKLQTYEAIALLDSHIAANVTDTLTETQLLRMQEMSERIDIAVKYKNYPEYSKLQNEFHNIYVYACGNSVLIKLLDSLRNSFVPQTYVGQDEDDLFVLLKTCNDEHKELIEAFKAKDKERVRSVLWKHWTAIDQEFI